MKKLILLLLVIIISCLTTPAQQITFNDGTTVNVNEATFDYEDMRRASLGLVIHIDGLAGSKFVTGSYLLPEKFHISTNVGFASINLETAIFFTGKTKEKEKGFAVKYSAAGYNTLNRYVLNTTVRKRKELGVYIAVNDYGHLLSESPEESVDDYPFYKQTTVYFGVAAVNYWHSNINVDDNIKKRGQYIGRTIFAPFITFGTEVDTLYNTITVDDAPKYGARLMYELSNTFGLLGAKIRGRTNLVFRAGIDLGNSKNNGLTSEIIFGFGVVYNFAGVKR